MKLLKLKWDAEEEGQCTKQYTWSLWYSRVMIVYEIRWGKIFVSVIFKIHTNSDKEKRNCSKDVLSSMVGWVVLRYESWLWFESKCRHTPISTLQMPPLPPLTLPPLPLLTIVGSPRTPTTFFMFIRMQIIMWVNAWVYFAHWIGNHAYITLLYQAVHLSSFSPLPTTAATTPSPSGNNGSHSPLSYRYTG